MGLLKRCYWRPRGNSPRSWRREARRQADLTWPCVPEEATQNGGDEGQTFAVVQRHDVRSSWPQLPPMRQKTTLVSMAHVEKLTVSVGTKARRRERALQARGEKYQNYKSRCAWQLCQQPCAKAWWNECGDYHGDGSNSRWPGHRKRRGGNKGRKW